MTFALLHLPLHADAVCGCPARNLAATAQGIYGGVAVGTMTAIITLVSGPLYEALGLARVLGHGAALCGCVADRVRDARDPDPCIRV